MDGGIPKIYKDETPRQVTGQYIIPKPLPKHTISVSSPQIVATTIDDNRPSVAIEKKHVETPTNADSFWNFTQEIDPKNWNKAYPYVLHVLQTGVDKERPGSNDSSGNYHILESFHLPIPPQSLSVDIPFASSTQVTLGGIAEDHNGAPIRTISLSGTTGVMAARANAMSTVGSNGQSPVYAGPTSPFGIFSGTAQSARTLVDTAQLLATGTPRNSFNLYSDNYFDETGDANGNKGGELTGFYQFHSLSRFLEKYMELRKSEHGHSIRLAFSMYKDQSTYLVTASSFRLERNASDPLSYNYTLNMKAWRRITLVAGAEQALRVEGVNSPFDFQKMLTKIRLARETLDDLKTTIRAVPGDLDTFIYEPLRQTTLFLKESAGLPVSLADMPAAVCQDLMGAVSDIVSSEIDITRSIRSTPGAIGRSIGASAQAISNSATESARRIRSEFAKGFGYNDTSSSADPVNKTSESQALVSSGSAASSKSIFAKPQDNYGLFSVIQINQLRIAPAIRRRIDEERRASRELTRSDFEAMRDTLEEGLADVADALGAGDPVFDEIYGRSTFVTTKTPSDDDYRLLYALNEILDVMNSLSLVHQDESGRQSAIDLVAGYARKSGIAFQKPVSKFAIPFPYGATLEQISGRYLGDANRWLEIVALNGLRAPYIDEEGFELPLLAIGNGHRVTVGAATNLYVGQLVTLNANNATRTQRRIVNIQEVSAEMTFITLDGEDDLARFGPTGLATLQAFLPDTINSNMQLYIPSQGEIADPLYNLKSIPGINDFAASEKGGVDLLLTQAGDLAITPDGDCRLAIGLANIVQQVRIGLTTPQGSLPQHPEYGLGLRPGMSTADLDAKTLLSTANQMFKGDSDFSGVKLASVQKTGPVATLAVSVGVAGLDQLVAVSVDVKR